jgi:hypothetical protein
MKRLFSLGALLLTSSWVLAAEAAKPTVPAQTSPDAIKAAELVAELGNPSFRVRDAAAKGLKKLGRHAKPALLDGMKSADPEVWNRCAQLLPEVMAIDLQARIDAYISDTEGKQKHDLPMIGRFEKLVGNDVAARKLFGDMIKTNGSFLESCTQDSKLAGQEYTARVQELNQRIMNPAFLIAARPQGAANQIDAIDLAALFLAGTDAEIVKLTAPNVNPVANFLWHQSFQNTLREGDRAVPFRKLFFAWAEMRNDLNTVSQTLGVIQNVNLKEGLDYAVKVMKSKDMQIWTRAQALTCVGKIGGKEQLPAFEAMFDDKTQITNIQWQNVNITTQLNDVALAMAVRLTNQSHKDYHFDALESQPGLIWSYHYLGFSTDEKRAAAFKKYSDWTAAQKKK